MDLQETARDAQTGELTLAGLIAELQRMHATRPDARVRISVNGKRRRVFSVYDDAGDGCPAGPNDRVVITHI